MMDASTSDRERFGTLKEEARRNTSRIEPLGVNINRNTMRMLVQPALDALAALGEPDTRCGTCAFRPGTVPAGCIQTQADALKCIMEDVPFMCHAHTDKRGQHSTICHGWFAARAFLPEGSKTTAPWPFTDDIERAASESNAEAPDQDASSRSGG